MFVYTYVSVEKTYELGNVKESEEYPEYLRSFKAHTVTKILQEIYSLPQYQHLLSISQS